MLPVRKHDRQAAASAAERVCLGCDDRRLPAVSKLCGHGLQQ